MSTRSRFGQNCSPTQCTNHQRTRLAYRSLCTEYPLAEEKHGIMAGSAGTNNVLSQFSGMLPLDGKVSFFDPKTGRKIKVTIEKPKRTARFWPFGSKKKQERAGVPDSLSYDEYAMNNLTVPRQPVTGTHVRGDTDTAYNPGPREHRDLHRASRSTSDSYEDIYEEYTNEATEPDHPPQSPPESPIGGSSDEDAFDKEVADIYHAMKRRASGMYVNVREPLCTTIPNSKEAALSKPDAVQP